MNATDRIVHEFDRLVAIGQERIPERSYAEQVVYFIVATRCEIDMEGFESVFEQAFKTAELKILIDGLRMLDESHLAAEFEYGLELLKQDGFYEHLNWKKVSALTKQRIAESGKRIGNQLWTLDEKLVAFLEDS